MVKIHADLCSGCGECAEICHESCMSVRDKKITINHDYCSTCGQCIAMCGRQALWWEDNRPEALDPSLKVESRQLAEFLMGRRTNRHLKPDKPPRELMEQVMNMGAYAPAHDFNLRCVAVDDEAIIGMLDSEILRQIKNLYNFIFKPPFIRWLLKFMPASMNHEFQKALPKLEKSIRLGRGYVLRPPAIIYIIGKKDTPLSLESAQYAAYNMDLYARTLGLACRNLTGNNMLINRSAKTRKTLGIKGNESIYAALAVGFQAKKFRNKITGRQMPSSWNGKTPEK